MLDLSYMKSCVFSIKVVTLNKDLCVAPESVALTTYQLTWAYVQVHEINHLECDDNIAIDVLLIAL